MARPLRLEYPCALYHITSRGNAQSSIFLSDHDRITFLKMLGSVITRYRWKCFSYCLMTNHYHLMIETPTPNLSIGMRQLNSTYSQKFNKTHNRVGHVLQGRYKSFVIEKERYFYAVCAYIVLNPVRAGIVPKPEDWQWSSFRAITGLEPGPEWLNKGHILEHFNNDACRYEQLVREQSVLKSPFEDVDGKVFLGSESFVRDMSERTVHQHDKKEIPVKQRNADRPSLKDIFKPPMTTAQRNANIFKAHMEHGYKQTEIADFVGIHYVTVSKIISNLGSDL